MKPARRLTLLPAKQMVLLTEAGPLSYRKKALSLENSPEQPDDDSDVIKNLDLT